MPELLVCLGAASALRVGPALRVYGLLKPRLKGGGVALAAPSPGRPLARRPSAVRVSHTKEPVIALFAPSEQALRAPFDRHGDPPSRRVARIAGVFVVITFSSIPALPLSDQVLHHTNFVVGTGGDARVYVGALFEIFAHRRHRHGRNAVPRPQAPERKPRAGLCDPCASSSLASSRSASSACSRW